MIYRNDIFQLKENINSKLGQKIIVKGSLGRNRIFEREGTIEETHPNVFVIKTVENNRNGVYTYTYTDILTKSVEIDVFDGAQYNPLIPITNL